MECPYCLGDFNDGALVCKSCQRNLKLVLPLIEENKRLIACIEVLQQQVNQKRAVLRRMNSPLSFWLFHAAVYVLAPAILLIAAHVVITVILDISPLYLRLISVVLPLPFGFVLLWFSHHGLRWSICDGALIGILAVAGMLAVVGYTDKVNILPENFREWRETLEYALSMALANVTGTVTALLARRMVPRTLDATGAPSPLAMALAQSVGRHVGASALRRRAQKIQDNFSTISAAGGALAAGAGSLYTGIRALLGGP